MAEDIKDDESNSGGAVLKPEGIIGAGMRLLKQHPFFKTCIHLFGNDIDFESIYPSWQIAGNISRETTKFAVKVIEGFPNAVKDLFGNLVDIKGNVVYVAKTYFGLLDFTEMEEEITKRLIQSGEAYMDDDDLFYDGKY